MKKRMAPLLMLCCLLLGACAADAPEATPTQQPSQPPIATIITTHSDGTVERMEHIYDESGAMTRADHYAGDKLVVSYAVTCDGQKRPLKMVDETHGSGISMEYTYNAQGQTVRIETKINGAVFFIQTYAYTQTGEKASYTEEDLRSASIIEYKYHYENGVLCREAYYQERQLQFTWEYIFDADGRRVSGIRRDSNMMEDGSREYKYADAVTTVITYDVQGKVTSTKTVHYAADGRVMNETFTSDGETTVTEYTYLQSK